MSYAPTPGASTAHLGYVDGAEDCPQRTPFHSHVELLDLPGSRMVPLFAHRLIDGVELVELVPPAANTPPERRLASSFH